ncbi:MAG: hypothetical protein WC348_03890 [Patescibacteria group bacterium]|jgi:hypothetical protein
MKKKNGRGKGKRKSSVDFAALKRMLAERQGKEPDDRETAEEGGYSALRAERPIETFKAGRRCKCCSCFLASSNSDNICHPCDKAIQEWKNFPWRRPELEREMEPHCLQFVHEHLAKKNKARGVTGGGERSSGSFARAIGRKTIERR